MRPPDSGYTTRVFRAPHPAGVMCMTNSDKVNLLDGDSAAWWDVDLLSSRRLAKHSFGHRKGDGYVIER
jgi:hypothetical protein